MFVKDLDHEMEIESDLSSLCAFFCEVSRCQWCGLVAAGQLGLEGQCEPWKCVVERSRSTDGNLICRSDLCDTCMFS